MMLAPVVMRSGDAAVSVMLPVVEARPAGMRAFSPLIDIVIAPAAVAVWSDILEPATRAREMAVPVMLVPEALIVCVP